MTFHYARAPAISPRDVCTSPLSFQKRRFCFPLLFLSPQNPLINWVLRFLCILYAHKILLAFENPLNLQAFSRTPRTRTCAFFFATQETQGLIFPFKSKTTSMLFLIHFLLHLITSCYKMSFICSDYVSFFLKTPVLNVLH